MLKVVLLLGHIAEPLGEEAFQQITLLSKYPKPLAQKHSVTAHKDLMWLCSSCHSYTFIVLRTEAQLLFTFKFFSFVSHKINAKT